MIEQPNCHPLHLLPAREPLMSRLFRYLVVFTDIDRSSYKSLVQKYIPFESIIWQLNSP